MKNIKFLIVALVMSVVTINFTSCGNGEKEKNPLADSLNGVNNELNGKLSEKEAALQEFVNSFNEIQDNLNTHNPSSFYETFSPDIAFQLSERFEMLYTPKKASWLNMAEIEFSALSKQCLDRRIGDIKILEKEVMAWINDRNNKSVIINWQFTKNDARITFDKKYPTL